MPVSLCCCSPHAEATAAHRRAAPSSPRSRRKRRWRRKRWRGARRSARARTARRSSAAWPSSRRLPRTGENLRVQLEAEDPEGDRFWVEYAWRIDGEAVEGSTPRRLLRGVPKGTPVEVDVTVRDRHSAVTETLSTEVANAAPVMGRVQVHGGETLTAGQPVLLRPEATDADGDELEFRYVWKVNGVNQNEDSDRFDTRQLARGDRLQATVIASDGEAQSEPFEIPALAVGNAAPRILSQPGELAEGEPANGDIFYQVRAEDPDSDAPLSYALEGAPEGMQIDPENGAIRWKPSKAQSGTHSLVVVVSDVQGAATRQAIEVTVGGGGPSAPAAPAD